jgi:hypothetical protein
MKTATKISPDSSQIWEKSTLDNVDIFIYTFFIVPGGKHEIHLG